MGHARANMIPRGPLALTGPVERPIEGTVPIRGDLAHIGLAGQYFVPHYIVPLERVAGAKGARLLRQPDEGAELIIELKAGQGFDVIAIEGDYAWGGCSLEGPSGYILAANLKIPGQ